MLYFNFYLLLTILVFKNSFLTQYCAFYYSFSEFVVWITYMKCYNKHHFKLLILWTLIWTLLIKIVTAQKLKTTQFSLNLSIFHGISIDEQRNKPNIQVDYKFDKSFFCVDFIRPFWTQIKYLYKMYTYIVSILLFDKFIHYFVSKQTFTKWRRSINNL